ncbi:MAG: hypothetical protein V3V14_03340 [Saprospiraceae bacterium]
MYLVLKQFNILFIIILITGCELFSTRNTSVVTESDVRLASVGNLDLYLSTIEPMINANNSKDSLTQLNEFIESWLKKSVLLNEAQIKLPEDVDLEKLVKDYRSSLLVYNYRQYLVNSKLDTLVIPEQLLEYYKNHKSQYLLEDPIFRVQLAVIPDKTKGIDQFFRNWKKGNNERIKGFLNIHSSLFLLNDSIWYSNQKLLSFLPTNLLKEIEISKKTNIQRHHNSDEFFIKILEVKTKNEIAPFETVRDKIKKVIIHKRKIKLIENIEQKLYDEYIESKRIRVFSAENF